MFMLQWCPFPVFQLSVYQHVLEHPNSTELEAQRQTQGTSREIGAQNCHRAQLAERLTQVVAREFVGQHLLLKES